MAVSTAEIIEKALQLPPEERVHVAEQLLQSLHPPMDPELEVALAEEMERRLQDVLAGRAQTYDNDLVVAELKAKYQL